MLVFNGICIAGSVYKLNVVFDCLCTKYVPFNADHCANKVSPPGASVPAVLNCILAKSAFALWYAPRFCKLLPGALQPELALTLAVSALFVYSSYTSADAVGFV